MTNETAITRGDLRQVIGQITDRVHQDQWPADSVNALQKSFIKESHGTSMTNEDKRDIISQFLYAHILKLQLQRSALVFFKQICATAPVKKFHITTILYYD